MQRATDDIAHLYQEFGGKPQNYRELTRTREAERARERWPLISRLEDLPVGAPVPPVRTGEDTGAEPLRLEDTAAAPVAAAAPAQRAQPEAERIEPTLTPQEEPTPAANEAPTLSWLRQPAPAKAQAAQMPAPAQAPPRHQPVEPAPFRVAAAPVAAAAPAPASRFTAPVVATPAAAPVAPQATVAPMFAALHGEAQSDTPPAPARMFAPLRAQPTAPAEVRPQAPAPVAAARSAAWRSPPAPASSSGAVQDPPAALPRPAARASGPEPLALQGQSPLSRLGQAQPQPADTPAKRPGGLQSLFARLLGRDDS